MGAEADLITSPRPRHSPARIPSPLRNTIISWDDAGIALPANFASEGEGEGEDEGGGGGGDEAKTRSNWPSALSEWSSEDEDPNGTEWGADHEDDFDSVSH